MKTFEWDDRLSIGISKLDNDHKQIIGLINALNDSIANDERTERLPEIFVQLVDYVLAHFVREEHFMQLARFPGLEEHRRRHNELSSKLTQLENQVDSSDTGILSLELAEFLRTWLLNHIALDDLQLRPYFAEAGLVDTPEPVSSSRPHASKPCGLIGRLRIGQQITVLTVLQSIGVLSLGAVLIFYLLRDVSDIGTSTRINQLTPLAGQLLTELQRERGLHSGFSRWGNSRFGRHLDEQRRLTDKALAAFLSIEPGSQLKTSNATLAQSIHDAIERLSQIESVRASSRKPGQTPRTIISHYSLLVGTLLDLVDDIVAVGVPKEARNTGNAYGALLHLREFLGRERALGTALFGADSPSPAMVDWFSGLIIAQSWHEHRFRLNAPANILRLFEQQQSKPVHEQVQDLRRRIVGSNAGGTTMDVDPLRWFRTATENIDAIISIEDELLASLVDQTNVSLTYARNKLIALGCAVALLTLVIVLLERSMVRSVIRPLTRLTQGMLELARGDRLVRVQGVARSDELGDLARAFEIFRASLIRRDLALAENRADTSNIEYVQRYFSHLSQAVNQLPVSVVISGLDGNIEYVNRFFKSITGYSGSEACQMSLRSILANSLGTKAVDKIWHSVRAGEAWEGETLIHTKSGEAYWKLVNLSPIVEKHRMIGLVYIGQNISERKQQEKAIEHQASHDALTNLPNRMLMLDRLSNAISRMKRHQGRLALMFLDLDNFKRVNDTVGHHVGDALLVETARRLTSAVRASDTVARQGGDEFLILAPELTNQTDIEPIAEKILTALSEPFLGHGMHLPTGASIGLAFYPDDGEDTQSLLSKADTAMYQAKADGGGSYRYFDASMNKAATRRLSVEQSLCRAQESGRLYLVYQPLVDLDSGRVTGAEVLLRWDDTTFGQVKPDEFIPIAEQTGLIIPIGSWVLDTAIRQAQAWREMGHTDFRISVNVSPRQLHERNFVEVLRATLNVAGLPVNALQLEVTEGLLVRNEEPVRILLEDLIKAGVSIVMDDFGTGYSSLSHLRKYPFDCIKVDKSFIMDMTTDPGNAALVAATIAMGKALSMKVTAEGVEAQTQLTELRRMDCDIAQGRFFSHPVPANEFTSLLGHNYYQ